MHEEPAVSMTDLLDQKVIHQNQHLQHVRRWWRGIHPSKGVICWGWTGWETVEERDCLRVIHHFTVAARQAKAA
jgi:hypothetical protein